MTARSISILTGSALLAAVIGCGGDDATRKGAGGTGPAKDPHQHADTLPGLVHELTDMRDTIRDSFAAEKPEDAHDPLHEVGHVLGALEKKLGDLPEEQKTIAKQEIQKLFDLFGKVDEKMHDSTKGAEYSDVSAEIDAALKSLADAVGDDHDDGDHKDGDHKDGDHKDGDHKDGDHKDGDHKDGDHKDGDHKDGDKDHKDGDKDRKDGDKDRKDGDKAANGGKAANLENGGP